MAYCDYSAVVFCGNERMNEKENAALFADHPDDMSPDWPKKSHHGILGDGNIRVLIHKCGLPEIYERIGPTGEFIEKISYYDEEHFDSYDFDDFTFEYKGYKFLFRLRNERYQCCMTEPDGTEWFSEYGYDPFGELLDQYE